MFQNDIQAFVTKFQMIEPSKTLQTSIVAKVVLRCAGTVSGGMIMSNGYYEGQRWIPTEQWRSDMVYDGDQPIPMWAANVKPNDYVMIPAVIWQNSKDDSVFAKLDQSAEKSDFGKTYYKYRHILLDRNGSMENIAMESMLSALYMILKGRFEQYNPNSYAGNITCMNCKSHIYVSPREEDEYCAPYRRSKSVQELREEGPAIALHHCLCTHEWIDEDCAAIFNAKYRYCPAQYVNEYHYLTALGNGKILSQKWGEMRTKISCRREHEPEEVPETSEENDFDYATLSEQDEVDDEALTSEDDEQDVRLDAIARKLGSTYVIDDETSDHRYDLPTDEQFLDEIKEAEYKDANKEAKALWVMNRDIECMFDKPDLTNEIREVSPRSYALDYNTYVEPDLYASASSCPHYCSSYKKGDKWVNVLYPNRVRVSMKGITLNQRKINALAEGGKAFRMNLSKLELIYPR